MDTEHKYKYYAFISYKREDEEWAKWLQHKLEHYKLPSNLNGRTDLPKEIRPVFKDTSELNPGNLPQQIHDALEQSRHLIVICSPRSAQSEWVNKEVETFMEMGRTDRIIPFIIDGKAFAKNPDEECFPKAIRDLTSEQEILGANIGEMGRDAAAVKVVAQMFGLKFDELWQRHEREQRRKRNWIIAASIMGLLVMTGIAFWMYVQRQQTLKANWKMMENQSRFVAEKASILLDEGDSYLARRILLEVLPSTNQRRPITPEAEGVFRKADTTNSTILKGHTEYVRSATFSPDGKWVISASEDKTIRIWDVETGIAIDTLFGHTDNVTTAIFSPDGKRIASASYDSTIRIWDTETRQVIDTLKDHSSWVYSASFSHDGKRIVSVSDKTIRIWDVETGKVLDTLEHNMLVYSAIFSPDGRYVYFQSYHKNLYMWDIDKDSVIESRTINKLRSFAISPDGRKLVTTSKDKKNDKTISIWYWEGNEWIKRDSLLGHTESVISAQFSNDGKYIVSTSSDHTVRIWNIHSGRTIIAFKNSYRKGLASFSPDGKHIVYSIFPNSIQIQSLENTNNTTSIELNQDIYSAILTLNGNRLITAQGNNSVCIRDARTGDKLDSSLFPADVFDYDYDNIYIKLSPEGNYVFANTDDYIHVWDVKTGDILKSVERPEDYIHCADFSSDEQCIALACNNSDSFYLWNFKTNWMPKYCVGHTGEINSLSFSPIAEDTRLVSTSYDKTARIWDAPTGQTLHTLTGHSESINYATFSFDGTRIATASDDYTIRIWDANTGNIIKVLSGHTKSVYRVAFSNDGKHIVSAAEDNTIRVWDVNTGHELQVLFINHPYNNTVNMLGFTSNGNHIVSTTGGGTIRIWDFPPLQELIDETRERFKDNPLTPEERRMYYLE